MFQSACLQISESVYALFAFTQRRVDGAMRVDAYSLGTGFMVAPGIIITAAHLTHVENDLNKPNHSTYCLIRAPDILQGMEDAELIVEDHFRDIALLRMKNPRSRICVTLERNIVPTGASCGSLGFPLSGMDLDQRKYTCTPRFQGGYISIYGPHQTPQGSKNIYETDSRVYSGSSGSPGFLVNGNVFGVLLGTLLNSTSIEGPESSRLAIANWTPSMEIISFAKDNDIDI